MGAATTVIDDHGGVKRKPAGHFVSVSAVTPSQRTLVSRAYVRSAPARSAPVRSAPVRSARDMSA
jgi:hypothetical protein